MTIGIFIESLDKAGGGPPRSVPVLAKCISELGMDVTIVCIKSDNMNTHILENTSVKVRMLAQPLRRIDFEQCFKECRFELIHTQGIWNPFYNYSVKTARRFSVPYVISPRGTLEPWAYAHNGWKKKIAMFLYEKSNLNKANCILATADAEAMNIRKLFPDVPIAVIPNGIDLNEYPLRSDDTIDRINKDILFLSRINPKKGVDMLISVWAKIHDQYPEWKVKIVGPCDDEKYLESLKKQIANYNLGNCISLHEPVYGEEKYRLYSHSSLFVLPTYSENFGMVVAEAMSCGLPVITTTGAPWECLRQHKLGWWIEPEENQLEEALKDALDSGDARLVEMGKRASYYVKQTYDSKEVSKMMVEVFEWILGRKIAPVFNIL